MRIQPDCGRARLRALSGASCSSMWMRSLRCAGGVVGSALSVAMGGVLGCGVGNFEAVQHLKMVSFEVL